MKPFIKIQNIILATDRIRTVSPHGESIIVVEMEGDTNNTRQIFYNTKAERDAAFKIIVISLAGAR